MSAKFTRNVSKTLFRSASLLIYIITIEYHSALNHKDPVYLAALTTLDSKVFNRLVVHVDSSLLSYSLDLLARIGLGHAQQEILAASIERLVEDHLIFFRHLHTGGRSLCS